ncbi:hypothetical protein [Methylobacterium haplocladii]|uniref:Uncharacterized protein n=1 Tax=Methylobacterium haplocladii TaxID=1176176 RepID=A0A512IUA8_9HYPH|nr:hypothetical protein [Methylobacterium haplocladii]GEP01288.1 hypothetical protein MHA02_36750 [Methylobacterium haplocladii]GJD86116.1 hypothetical protein HPGCJGGD_4013 [Methylobacterium haplocladii]GLS60434.1 hypothetical protein GCM10007887_31130 [Methylobacterium haplocladii]
MLTRSAFATVLMFAVTPAFAQAETGTGGGPASTVTAPHTTSVGQTKPPGAAAGPGPSEGREARTEQMRKDDQIMKGICIGCGTK